jgi:hypothetical protein
VRLRPLELRLGHRTSLFLSLFGYPGALLAAHPSDLDAARAAGLGTAYVARPLEHGPGGPFEVVAAGRFDWQASDFLDLAAQLEEGA